MPRERRIRLGALLGGGAALFALAAAVWLARGRPEAPPVARDGVGHAPGKRELSRPSRPISAMRPAVPPQRGPAQGEAPSGDPGTAAPTPEAAGRIVLVLGDHATGRGLAAETFAVSLRGETLGVGDAGADGGEGDPRSVGWIRAENIRSDDAARAAISGVSAGRYSLIVRHEDYIPARRVVTVPEAGGAEGSAGTVEVRIDLEPGDALEGIVLGEGGTPIARATVKLAFVGGKTLQNASALTGEDGTFLVRGLRRGDWRLTSGAPGFRRRSVLVDVPYAGAVRLELLRDPGFEIHVVAADDSPVGSARVSALQRTEGIPLGPSTGLTDSTGTLRLAGLPADPERKVLIEVKHPTYLPARRAFTSAELERGEGRVVLSAGSDVEGRVVDAAGERVSGAEVRLRGADDAAGSGEDAAAGRLPKSLPTTASGEFRFGKVPAGRYALEASTPDRGASEILEIDVREGEGAGPFELELARGDGSVSGRVLDPEGAPVRLCPVELQISAGPDAGGSGAAPRTVTDVEGRFRFEGLSAPIGTPCRISAGGGRLSVAQVAAAAIGRDGVEVVVEPLGTLVGLFTEEGPAASYTVALDPEGGGGSVKELRVSISSQDPWFRVRNVQPGTYRVSIIVAGETSSSVSGVRILGGKETGPVEF